LRWTDTDYAGCRDTRKSTSGGVIRLGTHVLRGWSSTQKVIALSSGEAEYYGMVRGGAEALGTQSILGDLGVSRNVKLMTDSSAAKGIAMRTGLGKVRHIEVNQLWLQEKVRDNVIQVIKVEGVKNIADALTKHVDQDEIKFHIQETNCEIKSGRHELAPQVTYRSESLGLEEEEHKEMEDTGDGQYEEDEHENQGQECW